MKGAENRAVPGEIGWRRGQHRQIPCHLWSDGFRQPEVEQLHAGLRQHDVAGLEITMDDAGAMCDCERVSDLSSNVERLVQRQGALLQPLFERLPFQVLHDKEVDVVVLSNVEHRANVRVTD